jgi:hypothetical protein
LILVSVLQAGIKAGIPAKKRGEDRQPQKWERKEAKDDPQSGTKRGERRTIARIENLKPRPLATKVPTEQACSEKKQNIGKLALTCLCLERKKSARHFVESRKLGELVHSAVNL